MITLELPVLVMVTACVADDVPVVTLPKLRLVGLMLNVWVAATAEPLRLTELGDVGALLTIERLPDTVPADVGLNVTVTVVFCPAFTFNGNKNPLTLNGAPVALIWLMLNVAVPLFVITKAWDAGALTTSLAKLIDVELN